jgi:NAD(P)H dehydrogenase (quinone)
MLALAAGSQRSYEKNKYDAALDAQVVHGIMHFCGIADARLHTLYDTLDDDATRLVLIARARELGKTFGD